MFSKIHLEDICGIIYIYICLYDFHTLLVQIHGHMGGQVYHAWAHAMRAGPGPGALGPANMGPAHNMGLAHMGLGPYDLIIY